MDAHPIQLRFIAVRELAIVSFFPPRPEDEYEPDPAELATSSGAFNPETRRVQVSLQLTSGRGEDPDENELKELREHKQQPFRLRVCITGEFEVDTANFPAEKVAHWAEINAPAILFPFLREHVYGLTVRCGYSPLLLPLIQVPQYRIKPEPEPPQVELAHTE